MALFSLKPGRRSARCLVRKNAATRQPEKTPRTFKRSPQHISPFPFGREGWQTPDVQQIKGIGSGGQEDSNDKTRKVAADSGQSVRGGME
jgi:hypothetical protein